MSTAVATNALRSWKANLDLEFKRSGQKTILSSKKHIGPLLVQKPFYPESKSCCHVYLIHPPAGIVGGDSLTINANLLQNSHALITTPAATKFYRSNGTLAKQNQVFEVNNHACLEWLPQETVYFNGAEAVTKTRINIDVQSKFIAWEIQCLGMPANEEDFEQGMCIQRFEIWQKKNPLILECNRLTGGDQLLNSSWGMHNNKSIGTLLAGTQDNDALLEVIEETAKDFSALICGYTFLNGLIIVRSMAKYAEQIREFFTAVWQALRPHILQLTACPPRIWQT